MSSLRTPTGMLSFPQLFQAKAAAPGAEPRFSINLIFDRAAQATPEFAALRRQVAQAIDAKWGAGKSQDREWIKRNKIRSPFRSCSDREYAGYDVEGGVFIAPWSKNKPGVVDARLQDILVPSDVFSGQLARCTVHAFAYDQQANKGIAFNLNNVQITRADMPRLDGRKEAKEEFDNIGADPELGDREPALADNEPPF